MSSANYVDYLVIALYALLMVRVGFYVLRFNRGAAEYFKGGNRIPWLVAGLSCFMAGFSAWTFTGAAGGACPSPVAGPGADICRSLLRSFGASRVSHDHRRGHVSSRLW